MRRTAVEVGDAGTLGQQVRRERASDEQEKAMGDNGLIG